ncbi:MAG: class I SAM-dependent methyltransferase [bacterium]|nr:class I SAM-dependent methyltransferase [bacterium]
MDERGVTRAFEREVADGSRFEFGKNWSRFLSVLNEERIRRAEAALREMLEARDLAGRSFLDVGSGSGLSSLAARRLGARVHSFDYDPQSVACTAEVRRRYFPDDPDWRVERGSVLDRAYLEGLGSFDVVYSWGVLHHTGDMRRALENVLVPLAEGGLLFIALYNDQGGASARWRKVKRLYCSGAAGRILVCGAFIPYFIAGGLCGDLLRGRNPLSRYTRSTTRGMSVIHDWFDWLGGLPFEVARPEEIFRFYRERGLILKNLTTAGGGLGNNQFVFARP